MQFFYDKKIKPNFIRKCISTYHKSTDASLWRLPFKAAVDVASCVDQEHDAAPKSVEVTQQQLEKRQRQISQHVIQVRALGQNVLWKGNSMVLYT